ncbi:MAG: Galactokinase [Acetothermia bacterium 64_32]|nr:MAG: Galactokinase [Acetothermia bacterium 64_32]HAF70972.1 galactokinase [Candidatus Acetothermia bacterium]
MTPSMGAAELLVEKFGPGPFPVVARAPGRVNLIGEHTDYNEGYVLPFAIDRHTEVALRPREDMRASAYAASFDEFFSVELVPKEFRPQGGWPDYLLGILRELSAYIDFPHGLEAAIVGNVPLGAGLSSSASLEVALAVGLARLYGLELWGLELVRLCQRAESGFVGMPCGIMDQYAAYFAEPNRALLLDTRAMEHQAVSLELSDVAFLVIDSSVRRTLTNSGYAERRHECEEAARWLAERFPERGIASLRDVDEGTLAAVSSKMPKQLWRRAKHVVEENARVLAAARALGKGDVETVGRLLYASHRSLRDLFEVSTPELDFLVEWGLEHGALGARLVGGGFGGVTLHLVPERTKEAYLAGIKEAFRRAFGRPAPCWEVHPGLGAKVLNEG